MLHYLDRQLFLSELWIYNPGITFKIIYLIDCLWRIVLRNCIRVTTAKTTCDNNKTGVSYPVHLVKLQLLGFVNNLNKCHWQTPTQKLIPNPWNCIVSGSWSVWTQFHTNHLLPGFGCRTLAQCEYTINHLTEKLMTYSVIFAFQTIQMVCFPWFSSLCSYHW